jgi:hypothetical protein
LADAKRLTAAEIQFDKLRPTPAKKAVTAFETAALSTAKKIERLKALRLARDLAEAEARPAAPAKRKRAKKATPAPKADADDSATLTGWWKDQKGDAPAD